MKFWQYAVGTVFAFFIFAATLVAENASWSLFSSISDPFATATALNDKKIIDSPSGFQDFFSLNGEFVRAFTPSEINFEPGQREFFSGEAFFGEALLDSFEQEKIPFSFSGFHPLPGQIKAGPFLIHSPGKNFFISRDATGSRLQIYAPENALELWFEGATEPFLIPQGMRVDVRETDFNTKALSLSYTELTKEVDLKPFSNFETPKISDAQKSLLERERKMEKFAVLLPQTWKLPESDSWVGNVISGLKNFRSIISIGYPQRKKSEFQFKKTVTPLVKALEFVAQKKQPEALAELQKLGPEIQSQQWKTLLDKNPSLKIQWEHYLLAQKAWFKMIPPTDPNYIFVQFWGTPQTDSSRQKLDSLVSLLENSVPVGVKSTITENLQNVTSQISTATFTTKEIPSITKARRIVTYLIKNNTSFQNVEFFNAYGTILSKELSIPSDEKIKNSLKLETGKDLLGFIAEKKLEKETSQVLLKIYFDLGISGVINGLPAENFSVQEKETIDFINLVGTSGLLPDEIAETKKLEEKQKELAEQLAQTLAAAPEPTDPAKADDIKNAGQLWKFLGTLDIKIDLDKFKTSRADNTSTFSDGNFKGAPVSGKFDYTLQRFSTFTAGETTQENVHRKFLSGLLTQAAKKIEEGQTTTPLAEGNAPENPRTTVEKSFVQTLFKNLEISIEKENITPLDETFDKFQIQNAQFQNLNLSFVYQKSTNNLFEVKVRASDLMPISLEIPDGTSVLDFKNKLSQNTSE